MGSIAAGSLFGMPALGTVFLLAATNSLLEGTAYFEALSAIIGLIGVSLLY
jgi:hypothetical protein